MRRPFLATCIAACVGIFFCVSAQNKLNVPRVLLPKATSDVFTKFKLEVVDGTDCFRWSSSSPEIASVLPNPEDSTPDGCSRSAVVSAVSRANERKRGMIWAERESQRFRTDVIVDTIRSLEIIVTTQFFFLEDNPEILEVRAKDAEGDTFSSLDGLEFQWNIENDRRNESRAYQSHNIVRMIKFVDTEYKAPDSISAMEANGKKGYVVLVEGLQTGSAIVTVSLKHPDFGTVEPASVRLRVVANLVLLPSHDVYIVPHGVVHYRIQQIKHAQMFDVTMPSDQYYLEVEKKAGCHLDRAKTQVACEELGSAKVTLKDAFMDEADATHPSTMIHVVQPVLMMLTIQPGRNWALQRGRYYEITVELYDNDNRLIYPSSNLDIMVEFPTDYFDVLTSTTNGSWHYVRAKKTGKTVINAALHGVRQANGRVLSFNSVSKREQTVEIFDPVVVSPKMVVLPYQSTAPKSYGFSLTGTGGSGSYTWSSSDQLVATIDRVSGKAQSGTKRGSTIITAFDVRNPLHNDAAQVYLTPVEDVQLLPKMREVAVGENLLLPVALLGRVGNELRMMSDCRFVDLKVTISDGTVLKTIGGAEKEIPEGGCAAFIFRGTAAGIANVFISFTDELAATITRNQTIAVFNPLRLSEPAESTVLAIGSSRTFSFEGGPAPWIFEPTSHRVELLPVANKMIDSKIFAERESSVLVKVYCTNLGEEDVIVEVRNAPTKTNPFPASSKASFRLACATPSILSVKVRIPTRAIDDQVSPAPICQWKPELGEPFPVLRGKDSTLEITVLDDRGRHFYNISSLEFKWEVSNPMLVDLHEKHTGFRFPWHHGGDETVTGNFKRMTVLDVDGSSTISATVTGYRREAVDKAAARGQHITAKLDKALRSSIHVASVREPHFDRQSVEIFNHPSNTESIAIRDGSGFFYVAENAPGLAKVSYNYKTRLLDVSPLRDGDLIVKAYDLCTAAAPAEIRVQVSGLHRIQVIVGDKVEVGQKIPLLVRVFDSSGGLLPVKFYPLISLSAVLSNTMVTLNPSEAHSSSEQRYSVYGASLGRCTIRFKATTGSLEEVSSKRAEIQVFPPIRLEPQNVTLLESASFQFITHGGPQPAAPVLFIAQKSSIASVDSNSGLVDANRVGETTVVAQIVGVDPVTGREVIYSKDQAKVHVLSVLAGVKIVAPVRTVEVGAELPLVAFGLNENETPFSFGSVKPAYKFAWTVENADTGDLKGPLPPILLTKNPENQFSVRLVGNTKGAFRVRLEVTGEKLTVPLMDQILIRYITPYGLSNEGCFASSIIVTPNTQTNLRTTVQNEANQTYWVVSHKELVDVDDRGNLRSFSRLGQADINIQAVENELTRTLVRKVLIKEPSYLRINFQSDMKTDESMTSLPLGVPFHFQITFHDEVGAQFRATNSTIRYRASRNDLLTFSWASEKNGLTVRALNPGTTVLKVWDAERPHLFDFVNIRSAPVIAPHAYQARIGEVVCFKCPVRSADGHKGVWSSSNPPVMYIDEESGVGLAVAAGSVTITNTISADVAPKTEVQVLPLGRISFLAKHDRFLTNVPMKDPVKIDVSLGSVSTTCERTPSGVLASIARRLWNFERDLFKCGVQFNKEHPAGITANDVFLAHSDIDEVTGQFQCVFSVRESAKGLEEALSNFDASMIVSVSAAKGVQEPDILQVDFLPAFHVHAPEVHLNHVQLESMVPISATPLVQQSLQLKSSDAGLFDIGRASSGKTANQLLYPVKLQLSSSLQQKLQGANPELTITSLRTGQKVTIPVRIRFVGDVKTTSDFMSTPFVDWYALLLTSVVIGALIGIIFGAWYLYQQSVNDRQYYQYIAATGQLPPSSNSKPSSPGSPLRGSPMGTPLGASNQPRRVDGSSLFQSSNGQMDKEEPDSFVGAANRIWSTNRNVGGEVTGTGLFRRSPGTF